MPKYVLLINFTQQGIQNIRENPSYRKTQQDRL